MTVSATARQAATASTVIVRKGMGPLGWLAVIFVVCKVLGLGVVANWSWWLVLLPLYAPLALVIGIWAIIFAVAAVVALGMVIWIGIASLFQKRRLRKEITLRRNRNGRYG